MLSRTALYAEFVGTFAMVFCGTAAMAVNETTAALAHEGVAITWGLIVMVMVYAFGEHSGAHFNPAVTVSFALAKRFEWKKVPPYIITQALGAIAASLAVIALMIVNSPSEMVEPVEVVEVVYEEPVAVIKEIIEEPEPIFVSGSEMETLWSTASQIANDLGVDKYQVMYAIYEANKDFFVNNDINAPRADRDYFVDLSIIETVDISFAASEVKRHIFCHC